MVHDLLASTPTPLLLVALALIALVIDALLATAIKELRDWRIRCQIRRRNRRRKSGRQLTDRMAVTCVSQDTVDRIRRGA